ncbi:MAG: HDIG domain-containing metalloprotein [Armatimonadota bacterium]
MDTDQLIEQLAHAFAGRQLFLVGGCLRDRLLGRPITDLDFATDAPPDETRRLVAAIADSVWLAGEKFGTVGLLKDGLKAEITTFRADTYDGVSRKPEVAFGESIHDDLGRRDFTINAMAQDAHTKEMLDPFGGEDDLRERLVRFVGDPGARIREDPLRMLRAVRFCAQLGFELDPAAAAAIAEHSRELARISLERIRDELDGMMVSPRPKEGLQLLADLGLAEWFLPEIVRLHLPEPARHHMKDVLAHTLDAVESTAADKALRYAALLHDIAKPETFTADGDGVHFYRHEQLGAEQARAILSRLRQPSPLIQQVEKLVRHHLRVTSYRSEWSDSAVRRLMYELGEDLDHAIALSEADVRASDPVDWEEFQARLQELRSRMQKIGEAAEIAKMRPLLNGDEVMELLGIRPGPKVGEVLDFLLDEQLEGRVTTREQALEAVRGRFG